LTCDFITDAGEKFPQTLLSSDFSTLARLKGVLNKKAAGAALKIKIKRQNCPQRYCLFFN
jgi:hypothetical protein